jgi:hypothetical protein
MSDWLTAAQTTPYREPVATAPGDLFFVFVRPDGDSFLGAASHAESYLRQGFTVSGEETVSDSESFRNLVSPGSAAPPASGVATSEATATAGVTEQAPAAP